MSGRSQQQVHETGGPDYLQWDTEDWLMNEPKDWRPEPIGDT